MKKLKHTASQQHCILSSSFSFGFYLVLSHHPHLVPPLILLFSFLFLFKNSDIFFSILHPSLTQKPYGSRREDTFFSGKQEKIPRLNKRCGGKCSGDEGNFYFINFFSFFYTSSCLIITHFNLEHFFQLFCFFSFYSFKSVESETIGVNCK